MRCCESIHVLVERLEQEGDRAEAVVAGEHGGARIFHPAVIEALCAVGEGKGKRRERLPRAVTEAVRLLPAVGIEDVAFVYGAGEGLRGFVAFTELILSRVMRKFVCSLWLNEVSRQ